MSTTSSIVAVFNTHDDAELAVKKLALNGFDIKNISVVGKGYHTDEHVVGFYNTGDRIKFWGKNGAFWGGLWGWLSAGIFITSPLTGSVVVLGYIAAIVVSALEGAVVVGGLSALGAALYSLGIPKDSILSYESAIKADGFLIMARGNAEEMGHAKAVLGDFKPSAIDLHETVTDSPLVTQPSSMPVTGGASAAVATQ